MSDSIHSEICSVLIVDSQTATSTNTTFLLKLAGCVVTVVKTMEEAINIVTTFYSDKIGPAIILIDNHLINSDLLDLVDLIAGHSLNSKILILDRTLNAGNRTENKYQVINSRMLLIEIRKMFNDHGLTHEATASFQRFSHVSKQTKKMQSKEKECR